MCRSLHTLEARAWGSGLLGELNEVIGVGHLARAGTRPPSITQSLSGLIGARGRAPGARGAAQPCPHPSPLGSLLSSLPSSVHVHMVVERTGGIRPVKCWACCPHCEPLGTGRISPDNVMAGMCPRHWVLQESGMALAGFAQPMAFSLHPDLEGGAGLTVTVSQKNHLKLRAFEQRA